MKNRIIHGDCVEVMTGMAAGCVDFILTDPPYIASYKDRSGRTVAGDDHAAWLEPAFSQMYRLLKPDSFCVSFYGWPKAELFLAAWRKAGFRIGGHLVFRKRYASSAGYLQYRHEQAYVLLKGRPRRPNAPLPDVLDWSYTGNRLHPTQKPLSILTPLIGAFSEGGDTVLDPFCGSASTLLAARDAGRSYIGIELEAEHYRTSRRRLGHCAFMPYSDAGSFRERHLSLAS